MVRLFLILIVLAALGAAVWVVAAEIRDALRTGRRRLRSGQGHIGNDTMASSGIQKAAYIALIIMLFGVASGWLGGL